MNESVFDDHLRANQIVGRAHPVLSPKARESREKRSAAASPAGISA
jgi:hypothetical protein